MLLEDIEGSRLSGAVSECVDGGSVDLARSSMIGVGRVVGAGCSDDGVRLSTFDSGESTSDGVPVSVGPSG